MSKFANDAARRLHDYNLALAEAEKWEALAESPDGTDGHAFSARWARQRVDARLAEMQKLGDPPIGGGPSADTGGFDVAKFMASYAPPQTAAPMSVPVPVAPPLSAAQREELEIDAIVARIVGAGPYAATSGNADVDAIALRIAGSFPDGATSGSTDREPKAGADDIDAIAARIAAA